MGNERENKTINTTELPKICAISDTVCDADLIKNIADIEGLIQPHDSWHEQDLTALLEQDINECWVLLPPQLQNKAENEGRSTVIAYCVFSQVFEVAEILRIGTHPNFQRRGWAELLLKSVIGQLANKQLEKILLEVRADNHAAIHLYNKMGFNHIHTRKGYYTNSSSIESASSCDALVMQYVFDEPDADKLAHHLQD